MTPFHQIDQALTPAECRDLIALCQTSSKRDAGLVRATTAHQIRRAELSWLDDLPQAAWVMDRMVGLVAEANRAAFGFDLTDFAESPQVARYGAEREAHFDWHTDIGRITRTACWSCVRTAASVRPVRSRARRRCFPALCCTA
jgi:PKHD-type hydroxylase